MSPDCYLTPDGEEESLADTLLQVQQECLRLQRQNESLKAQLETYKRAESFAAKVFNMITILSVTMLAIAFRRKLRHG
jgi:hypothetical protein